MRTPEIGWVWGMMSNGRAPTTGQHVGRHRRRTSCELKPPCVAYDPDTIRPAAAQEVADGMLMVGPEQGVFDACSQDRGRHTVEPHTWSSGCDVAPECRPSGINLPRPAEELASPIEVKVTGSETVAAAIAASGLVPDPVAPEWTADYRPPPTHYDAGGGLDPWRVWDAFDLDRYTANAVKYLLRAGKKDIAPRLDDLKKARDYVNKAIEREELK